MKKFLLIFIPIFICIGIFIPQKIYAVDLTAGATTISLGGRFQYFKPNYDKDDSDGSAAKFYGITLTATYTFSI